MTESRGKLFLMVLATTVASGAPAIAATLEVDDSGGAPYSTIGAAIAAATPNVDDVFVHCGLYHENIQMRDGVSVTGAGPPCTVIDGSASGSVVTAIAIGSLTVLEGLTIRNGSAERGGGIFVEDSSLRIRGNVIESNTASFYGGGIHITRGYYFDVSVIAGNVIRGNYSDDFGGGIGAVQTYVPSPGFMATIMNNLIEHNTARRIGGGIDVDSEATVEIINNTIVRNCLQGAEAACTLGGGGVNVPGGTLAYNNLIAWNESGPGQEAGVRTVCAGGLDFRNNNLFGNQPVDCSVWCPPGTLMNIYVDPLLVGESSNPAGYQPRSDSPLVDAGTATLAPAVDVRGVPRPLDGRADGTPLHDIGARENEGITRLAFTSPTSIGFDLSVNSAATFNLYRGDLQFLRSTGEYTQDTSTLPGARRWCGLNPAEIPVTDADSLSVGETRFYLAVVNDVVEGTLGYDGTPAERPFTDPNRCP